MKKNISLLLTLFLCVATLSAQQVDTITIHSKMGHDLKNVIILPESYTHSDTRYPVVYLLHGCGDNYSAWLKIKPELPQIASLYNFIIVCPDGKINSWYWNSPRNKDMQFEDYISDEVIRYVDSHFRTIPDRKARAISGLSMGVINLIPSLNDGDLAIIIDCGVDDFFLEVNRRTHQALLTRNIKHDYIERPGGHNHAYWNNSIDYQLLFFHKYFSRSQENKSKTN